MPRGQGKPHAGKQITQTLWVLMGEFNKFKPTRASRIFIRDYRFWRIMWKRAHVDLLHLMGEWCRDTLGAMNTAVPVRQTRNFAKFTALDA
ncbi:MAG: hypothetical protein L3J36_09435 [Rhodobacteraceae bacterium]|nr:hypothetical protein [Paracoccaceae bacterium]